MENVNVVEIITLGNFYIKITGNIASNETGRTQKLWHLLSLLIANGGNPISTSTIIDSLWPEKDADEASKALNNLIFRMKRFFMSNGCENTDFFNCTQRSCMLKKDDVLYIDAYDMEASLIKGKNQSLPNDERISQLYKAVELYKGEFFLNSYNDASTMIAVNYYKNIFIEASLLLAEMQQNEGNIEESVRICEKAISLEPYEDSLYIRMFDGMRQMGQNARAVIICENYFRLLYNTIGISSSIQLTRLYQDMKGISDPSMDAIDVMNALEELTQNRNALLCNIELFRDIYQYEVRQATRRDVSVFIVLVSIRRINRSSTHSIESAMRTLRDSCSYVLRCGDTYAMYSDYQYVIMLSKMATSNWSIIENRLSKYFFAQYKKNDVLIKFDICQALPLGN